MLDKIITAKKTEIAQLYNNIGLEEFKSRAASQTPRSFMRAIYQTGLSIIAEVKKASPSKGIIRQSFNPTEIATEFEENGAAAISCLTERKFFLGSPQYLTDIKKKVGIPVLRKDFIIDPIQVYEAKAMGADALLLIKALLSNEHCQELMDLAQELNLDVLIEIHDKAELEDIEKLHNVKLIGINNRNLSTFDVDLNTAITLFKHIQKTFATDVAIIAESGYSSPKELEKLEELGFNGVLIGEGFFYLGDNRESGLINCTHKRSGCLRSRPRFEFL